MFYLNLKIIQLGITFKKNSDDLRSSGSYILYKKLSSIADKGKRGEASEVEMQEFYKLLVLYGQIYARTAGDLSGAARKMRVSQEIVKEQPDLAVNLQGVEDITRYLEENYGAKIKDPEDFKNLSTHFLMLREDQVTKFAKDGLASKFANGLSGTSK